MNTTLTRPAHLSPEWLEVYEGQDNDVYVYCDDQGERFYLLIRGSLWAGPFDTQREAAERAEDITQ